jgi:hypothetical protein
MIKDIEIPTVANVTIAIARKKNIGESDEWFAYLINRNEFPIENTLVASNGYGEKDGKQQKTSILRHYLQTVQPNSAALIEPLFTDVFHLNNEYWVSYYIGNKIFDKRFVFVPDTICEENLIFVKELDMQAVLHS